MRLHLTAAALFVGLSSVAAAASNMYRWVDARGQVHYSQTPPKAGGFKDVTPRLPPPPVGKAAVAPTRTAPAALPSPTSVADMNRKTAEYNASIKAQNCKNTQARLAQVKAQGPASALRQGADGSVVPYGPADYQREVTEAQQAVTDTCG